MNEALIGLIGVILGSLITGYKDVWLEVRNRKRNTEHQSILLVCLLDVFVEQCADVTTDNGLRYGAQIHGETPDPQVIAPRLDFPTNIDWKILPTQIMYELLSFPNLIRIVERKVSDSFDNDVPPFYDFAFEKRQYEYATLGVKAASIAKKIRKIHDLEDMQYSDVHIELLNKAKKRIEMDREARNQAQIMNHTNK